MDFSESAYGALLEEIFLRFPSVQKTDFARAYKPGLEGMEAFCEALGHPERSFRSIHVAGTNGKGSVASLLTSALSAVGLRTGLYTSPHLVDFRERARIVSPGLVSGKNGHFDENGLVSGREGLSSASLRDPIRANAPESPSPSESETSGSVIPSEAKESFEVTATPSGKVGGMYGGTVSRCEQKTILGSPQVKRRLMVPSPTSSARTSGR